MVLDLSADVEFAAENMANLRQALHAGIVVTLVPIRTNDTSTLYPENLPKFLSRNYGHGL